MGFRGRKEACKAASVSSLGLDLLDCLLDILLDIRDNTGSGLLLLGLVGEDSGNLDQTDDSEEEVDGGEAITRALADAQRDNKRGHGNVQNVLGLDDKTPAGPDKAGTGQGEVLGEGEVLGGAREVGDAGNDESPL